MKLKNCPSCGSKPRCVERKRFQAKYGVGCSNNLCIFYLPADVLKRDLHNYVWMYVEKERMAADWNRRPGDSDDVRQCHVCGAHAGIFHLPLCSVGHGVFNG